MPTSISTTDAARHLPAVVWAEALAGVRLADSAARGARRTLHVARRMARLEALRRVMGIEPFTAETAEHHADIQISRMGEFVIRIPKPEVDLKIHLALIAAIG